MACRLPTENFSSCRHSYMYTAGMTMEVQVLSLLYAVLMQVKLLLLFPSRDRSRSCMGIPISVGVYRFQWEYTGIKSMVKLLFSYPRTHYHRYLGWPEN